MERARKKLTRKFGNLKENSSNLLMNTNNLSSGDEMNLTGSVSADQQKNWEVYDERSI
jgi:hypothetical protein